MNSWKMVVFRNISILLAIGKLWTRIALEAAKGLEYLYEQVSPLVIHRNFHAKVSDFGLAKVGLDKAGGHVSTRVLGTQGYVAPEYALTGHLTTKSDVYNYDIVLLELLTGRVPVDMKRANGEGVLVSWALPQLADRDKVVDIISNTRRAILDERGCSGCSNVHI